MGYRTGLLGAVGALALSLFPAHAHVELEQYLQQRVTAVVTPANIDLTIELLYTSPVSLTERMRIDTNGDMTLSEDERRAYLEVIQARAEEGLTLRIDGVPCVLTSLHDPELNFLDSEDLEAHPHVLRLFYFARTPGSFERGSTLAVDSRLWTDGPSLVASSVRGADGIEVHGSPNPGLKRPSEKSKSIRVLEATCVSERRVKGEEAKNTGEGACATRACPAIVYCEMSGLNGNPGQPCPCQVSGVNHVAQAPSLVSSCRVSQTF